MIIHSSFDPKLTLTNSTTTTEFHSHHPDDEQENSFQANDTAFKPTSDESSNIHHEYHIIPQVLGFGRNGSVRECIDRTTGLRFAVKSISKNIPASELASIPREIKLLHKMKNHPNIIRLVDVHEDEDYVHLVTDLCKGGELFDRIVKKTSESNGRYACFAEDEAARIMYQLLTSIFYMHKRNIAHRDIKPENILFETTDVDSPIKIIDFGLATRHRTGEAPMHTTVGTPNYIAPDVLRRRYTKSCDLWSAGVIAYVLMCGYTPFYGASMCETHMAVLRGQYYFYPEEWNVVSVECKDFIRRLLQIDARKRMTVRQALTHPWILNHMRGSLTKTEAC